MKPKKPLNHQSNLRIFAANSCKNPFIEINDRADFSSENLKIVINCVPNWKELTEKEFQWILDLTERNMKTHYEHSENGWNPKQKEKEFKHETARFLLCRQVLDGDNSSGDSDGRLIAFVHFRFEMDDENKHPVIYCYEIQVVDEFQSKGIGKHLMHLLYQMASRFKMNKVMLTCFKHNQKTLQFYTGLLGYAPDVCSPSVCGLNKDYEILSKRIK